jgi:hypothetical protein
LRNVNAGACLADDTARDSETAPSKAGQSLPGAAARNRAMDADLTWVVAFAELGDDAFERLITANYGVLQTAPGPRAWIVGALERLQSAYLDRPKLANTVEILDVWARFR